MVHSRSPHDVKKYRNVAHTDNPIAYDYVKLSTISLWTNDTASQQEFFIQV